MSIKTVSLDGIWRLKGSSGCRGGFGEWPNATTTYPPFEAKVPGTVQQALESLTGDVNLAHNSLNARWIEESYWNWYREFTLTAEDVARRVRIVFDGLDLTARIYINRRLVGEHNNFFTPCRIDISDYVHEGENQLTVVLESGLFYAADKKTADTHPASMAADYKLHKRSWLRKPQSAFEWDWAPRLLTVGIYKSCRLEIGERIFADEASVFATVSEDYSTGKIKIRQFVRASGGDGEFTVTASVSALTTASVADTEDGISTVSVTAVTSGGAGCAELLLTVPRPLLWNPRGYGEPNRYAVRITVSDGAGIVSESVRRVGFRRVRIDQSPHPEEGYYFIVNINGNNIFAKGGNFVPADIIYSRLYDGVYETLIDRALEANFNALRVWGGGLYESERFYDLCDEHGIIVWQDFITACAGYPGYEGEFYRNYRDEVRYEIRRMSNFPCLVIWSGNNEIDWQIALFNENAEIKYPDAQLYYWLLPRTLKEEGDDRFYQPSSPFSFDFTDDNSDIVGDQHPWSVPMTHYENYRRLVSRFADEGGVLGPTSLPNTLACLGEGQRFIHSYDWQHHDNSSASASSNPVNSVLLVKFGRDITSMSIEEYICRSGFCQGEGLTEYIMNYRRRMYSSASAIFWMYNDCWPATSSWTIVDYLRNRTPAFYPVKRSYAPIAVDIVETDGGYAWYGINERLYEVSVTLEYGAVTPAGEYDSHTVSAVLPPNSSTVIATLPRFTEGFIPYALLDAPGEPQSRRRLVSGSYTSLGLLHADIKAEISDCCATYTSDRLVLGVCIDINGDHPLGDNFFDLYPGKPYHVTLGENSGRVIFTVNDGMLI